MWEEKVKIYDALVALCDGIERKGKTVPYTSDNGHMFSTFNKDGQIGIRFSKDVQKKYIEEYNTSLFTSYNAVMQGYILITDEMLQDMNNVAALLKESQKYVFSLPSK